MPGIALGREDMGVAAQAQIPVWASPGCIHELWLLVSISLLCGTVGLHAGEVRGLPFLACVRAWLPRDAEKSSVLQEMASGRVAPVSGGVKDLGAMCLHCGGQLAWKALLQAQLQAVAVTSRAS